ncbi:hypothetical protein NIES2100_56290 [Calothrix sp. NIES-2100]|uniref:hypothetical protein n=1 Tax=Calothrix sp. NIES-2100 TaxID=1954172 RepID=UPI000B610A42|nr:hypothetical protein NIES2100_56290 [Calothrix sp. NIES-2100]
MGEFSSALLVGWVEQRNPTQLYPQTIVGFHIRTPTGKQATTQPTKLPRFTSGIA